MYVTNISEMQCGIRRALDIRAELVALVDSLGAQADAPAGEEDICLDDLKAVLDLKSTIGTMPSSWNDRRDVLAAYRSALARRLPPALQVRVLLDGASGSIPLHGAIRDELSRHLASPDVHARDVAQVWTLLRLGAVKAAPAWLSIDALVEHALKPTKGQKKPTKPAPDDDDSDSDDGCVVQNPRMTPAETFLVQLAFSAADGTHDRAIALRIGQECDARLAYQPRATPRRLEGELLGQIAALARDISPAIVFRRDVGVVFNNRVDTYRQYDPDVGTACFCPKNAFGCAISVELPYLVYALVDRVEVDVASNGLDAANDVNVVYVAPGNEVLVRPVGPFAQAVAIERAAAIAQTIEGVVGASSNIGSPCTHVSIALDGDATVLAVRVYGRAIVW